MDVAVLLFVLGLIFALGALLGARHVEHTYACRKRVAVCPKCNGSGRYSTFEMTQQPKSIKCEVCLMRGTVVILDSKPDAITNVARST